MHIVRYRDPATATVRVGVDNGEMVTPVGARSVAALLARPRAELEALLRSPSGDSRPRAEVDLCPFPDGDTEVWAAGVTYRRSRDARIEESSQASVYDLVYDAERPEIFFKSVAWRVVGDGDPICIRRDSEVNVPEPELALVVNAHAEIVGYAVCNDMSSRSIEGANPIYLPQAKIYAGACALSTGFRPVWEAPPPTELTIGVTVTRGGVTAWADSCHTGQLRRSFQELIGCAFAEQDFPAGLVLSTGTGVVPPLNFSLQRGDVVSIHIEGIGSLTNPVTVGKDEFAARRLEPA